MKEWMSEGFPGPPQESDNPSMCVYGFGDGDWDVFCERCGYSASEILNQVEADRVADAHLLKAHGIGA